MTRAERITVVLDLVAGAKSAAMEALDAWPTMPDVDASSGELEQAVGLLGRVETDLEREVQS